MRDLAQPDSCAVLIIGAGPVGLAAAAKCVRLGIGFLLVEAGPVPAWSVSQWGHVRLFSPWSECLDEDAVSLLHENGWTAPPAEELPTGSDLISTYLAPLAQLPKIRRHLRFGQRIARCERLHSKQAGFVVTTAKGNTISARAVIDASGTWDCPRRLPGARTSSRIHYGIPDIAAEGMREAIRSARILLVGSGHSAMTILLHLLEALPTESASKIIWVRNRICQPLCPSDASQLGRAKLERRAFDAASDPHVETIGGTRIARIEEREGQVFAQPEDPSGSAVEIRADVAFVVVGFDPDHGLAANLKLAIDPHLLAPTQLAPLIDPAKHTCNTVPAHGVAELAHPEEGFFIVGSKSYGRAPNFALKTGYAQLDSVLESIATVERNVIGSTSMQRQTQGSARLA